MAYSTVTLTGRRTSPSGRPHRGYVTVEPSVSKIIDGDGNVVLSGRSRVDLVSEADAAEATPAGSFSIELPATDDAGLNPTGFTYLVRVVLHDGPDDSLTIDLPAAVPVVDLADKTEADPSAPTYTERVNEATEAATAAGESATLAASSATTASTAATTAQAAASEAETSAGEATTAAGQAAASVAEIAVGEPGGVAPLDGTGKLPEANVPERLSEGDLSATIAAEVEPKADKAKTHPLGGQYLAPVRVPTLSVVESWPNQVAPFLRLMWTESNGATLYAYGRDRSVWKSTDSGVTWTRTGSSKVGVTGIQFGSVFWKTTAGSLLAFRYDYDQLYRSTDDGATWASVHTLPFKQLLGAQSIAQDLVTGYVYYAEYPTLTGKTSTTAKLWRSTDDGVTWTVFYSFPTSGAGAIDHIHTIQWDHVAQRIVISAGDSNPAAGLYRINAAGTGVEPMVLHSNLPPEDLGIPRSIGIIPTTNYIVWAADTGNVPWVCRMHRDQIGLANPVVEKVYRLNSSAWWTCKASDDGSRWVVCASGENPTYRIDTVSHLYAVEDEGATVYEIGTIRARKEDTVTLAPVGAPGNHGDIFFMQTHTDAEPGTWKFALGLGSGIAIPWPQRIQVPMTKTLNHGPVSIAAGAEVVFSEEFVPYRATTLHLFDMGATAGVRCVLRINGVDILNTGQRSERAIREAEWSAAFLTHAAAGGQSVQIILKNQGGATVTDARVFCTYGWGSGAGLV